MNDGRSSVPDFASEPPPGEKVDVHSASTAVAVFPDSFLDDLRRGNTSEPTTSKYKVLPDTLLEEDEPPPPPPLPISPSEARVRELNAVISAALTVAAQEEPETPDDEVCAPLPVVAPEPMPPPQPAAQPPSSIELRPEERWFLIAVVVAVLAAWLLARRFH